jgi:hypothetical protein
VTWSRGCPPRQPLATGGRSDLHRAERARVSDRPQHLLRGQDPSTLETRAARRRDHRPDPGRTSAAVPGPVRCPHEVAPSAPPGPRRGPVHGRAADDTARLAGRREGQASRTTVPDENGQRSGTWSTGTSPRPLRTASGSPTSPTSRPGPGPATSLSSSTSCPAGSSAGARRPA